MRITLGPGAKLPQKMTTIVSSATANCGFSTRKYGADHFRMAADSVLTQPGALMVDTGGSASFLIAVDH